MVDGVPGIVLRRNGFIPLGATQCQHRDLWGGEEEHCPGPQQEQTLPGRADVEFVFLNSLLKVKHLQLRKSFRSASRRYFLHGSGGVGFGALQCFLIVKPKPDAPLYG